MSLFLVNSSIDIIIYYIVLQSYIFYVLVFAVVTTASCNVAGVSHLPAEFDENILKLYDSCSFRCSMSVSVVEPLVLSHGINSPVASCLSIKYFLILAPPSSVGAVQAKVTEVGVTDATWKLLGVPGHAKNMHISRV